MRFNWRAYWLEIQSSYRFFAIFSIISLLIYFFHVPIVTLLLSTVGDPLMSHFINDKLADIISCFLLIIVPLSVPYHIFHRRVPSPRSIFFVILLLSLYFFVFRNSDTIAYMPIAFNRNYYYFDCLITAIAALSLRYKTYGFLKVKENRDGFVEDILYDKDLKDVLAREPFAADIARSISNTAISKAFTISISGRWGAGKSVFMKFLKKELKKVKENEIVEFNPWKATDEKLIIDDFFVTLSAELKKYDKDASGQVRKYGKYLAEMDEGLIGKVVGKSISLFTENEGLSAKYEDINKAIKLTGRRFIIFIDDVDRLTGKEVFQVLKLVRNMADFGNIFFIVALDPNYVVSSLRNTAEFALESEYTQKIFQLEVLLPPIGKIFLLEKMYGLLSIDKMSAIEKAEFDNVLQFISQNDSANFFIYRNSLYSGIFEDVFLNLRDVVRFVNSFKIRYRILKGEVDLYDIFLIEMIKLHSSAIYNALANKSIIDIADNVTPKQYKLNEQAFNKLCKDSRNNVDKDTKRIIRRVLKSLLDFNAHYKTSRSVAFPDNFPIYFNYQLFENVSIVAFRQQKDKSVDEFFSWISEQEKLGKKGSLFTLLSDYSDFSSKDELEKFILLFMRMAGKERAWVTHIRQLLKDRERIKKYYQNDVTKAGVFITSLFNNKQIDEQVKIELGSAFTREAFDNHEEYYLKAKQWQDLVLQAFKEYKKKTPGITNQDFDLYIKNWTGRDERENIIINSEASETLYEYINQDKEGYLIRTLRSYYTPPGDLFVFDPFIDYIFGDQQKFEKFLKTAEAHDTEYFRLLVKYYEKYKENGFKPIPILDTLDREAILKKLASLS